jgi:hypothetical protein
MKRCDICAGPFGLIVYRHYARRFCSKHCKEHYLRDLRRRAHVSTGLQSLALWPREWRIASSGSGE